VSPIRLLRLGYVLGAKCVAVDHFYFVKHGECRLVKQFPMLRIDRQRCFVELGSINRFVCRHTTPFKLLLLKRNDVVAAISSAHLKSSLGPWTPSSPCWSRHQAPCCIVWTASIFARLCLKMQRLMRPCEVSVWNSRTASTWTTSAEISSETCGGPSTSVSSYAGSGSGTSGSMPRLFMASGRHGRLTPSKSGH
jgi:hypothetical protein